MTDRLSGKIAIITGAAGGMGEASAHVFAQEGCKVVALDVNLDGVSGVAAAIKAAGGDAIAMACDVTKAGDIEAVIAQTLAVYGAPNVLFNNAGVDLEQKKTLLDIDEAAFDKTMEVNVKGVWLMMKHVAPHMMAAGGGSIINTASVGATLPVGSAGYCASKAGVVMLTKVAAKELSPKGIRVNTLSPGCTETPMAKHQREEMKARGLQTSEALMPFLSMLGRFADPKEMAQMALFLASDESSFATGANFVNDGGMSNISGVPTG